MSDPSHHAHDLTRAGERTETTRRTAGASPRRVSVIRSKQNGNHSRTVAQAPSPVVHIGTPEMLDALFAAIPDAMMSFDTDGNIVRINEAFERLLGVEVSGAYSGQPISVFMQASAMSDSAGRSLTEDQWPIRRALCGERLTSAHETDLSIRTLDGRIVYLSPSGGPLLAADGSIIGGILVFRDVTAKHLATAERVQARQRLQQQATELEGVFSALTTAVIVFDSDGHITRLNPVARTLYEEAGGPGYEQRPMSARVQDLIIRDSAGKQLPPERWPGPRVLRGERISGEDVQYLTRDGAPRVLSLSGVPLYDDDGTLTGGVTLYQDVTERRLLERRTHASLDALLRMAQDAVGSGGDLRAIAQRLATVTCEVMGCRRVGVMGIEKETRYIHALAVVGLAEEEEKRWWAMQAENTRFDEGNPELIARFVAGEPLIIDMTQPPFDQQPNPFGITTALHIPMLLDNQIVGFISLDHAGAPHLYTEAELALGRGVADLAALVVERDRLQRERATAEAEALALGEASRRMDDFIGRASHELRTPLTSAFAATELAVHRMRQTMESMADESQPKLAARLAATVKLLETSSMSMSRLSRLIADLLEARLAQTDQLELYTAPLNLADVARGVIAEQQALWPHRIIEFAHEADPEVIADGDRIHQAVTNCLINALKYAPPEAPIIVRLTAARDEVRIAVIDQGPGLTIEQQAHIWERYYRVGEMTRHEGSSIGLGLGLYITRAIMLCHGGAVGVESTPGAGTTFWLSLPM